MESVRSMISIGFNIEEGANGFKTLITEALSLQKVKASPVTGTEKLRSSRICVS